MKNNLEIVRQAVIKANPSIMELGFGCEIIYERKKGIYLEHIEGFADCFKLYKDFKSTGMSIVSNPKLKSLGRPIRLADVLLAIRATNSFHYVGVDGHFYHNQFTEIPLDQECAWNLLDDDLNHQSPETLAFLASLLSENKQ